MNKTNTSKRGLTLKTLNKSNVWDVQENDIFRMWEMAEKESDLKDNARHYLDIIKSAFEIEEIKIEKPEVFKKYEARDFKVGQLRLDENTKMHIAIKKKAIMRVTDLTYENIRHISATKLLEVIDRNFGGGWDSLSQSIQDIIQSGFDISTTTLPKDRLHKKGGMCEKKLNDGFEILEIPKGTWVEAIFAKLKPVQEKPRMKFDDDNFEDNEDADDDVDIIDDYNSHDDDDDYDEDKLTEESYRTTFDEDPDALGLEDADIVDEEDY